MTATNHAMMGAVIALAVKRSELAIPLAFLSHFILDAVPHFGVAPGEFVYAKYRKFLLADMFLLIASATVLALMFSGSKLTLMLACGAAAVFPDAIWYFYRRQLEENDLAGLDPFSRLHQKIQTKEFLRGIYIEAPLFVILWSLVIRSSIS